MNVQVIERFQYYIFVYLLKIDFMKKIITLSFLSAIFFSACKKKDTVVEPNQWPEGTSDYAPNTIGSTFTFETSTGTPAVIDSFTYTVVKDTTINGVKYYKLTSNKPAVATTYYSNYTNGVVTEINYNFTFQGFSIPNVTQTVVKDNVPVSTAWNDLLTIVYSGFPVQVTFAHTLMQNDITKNVLNKDYANAIEVKDVISIPPQYAQLANLPFSSIQVNNFYGKGVGLIQKDGTGNIQKIKRFNIVK
jgi:hypothetical protein